MATHSQKPSLTLSASTDPTSSTQKTQQKHKYYRHHPRRHTRPTPVEQGNQTTASPSEGNSNPATRTRVHSTQTAAGSAAGGVTAPRTSVVNPGEEGRKSDMKAKKKNVPHKPRQKLELPEAQATSTHVDSQPIVGPSLSQDKVQDGNKRGIAPRQRKAHVPTKEEHDAIETARREKRIARRAKKKAENYELVLAAAKTTVDTLKKYGISCATFGSLACKLYGGFRDPKDVDLLVLQPTLQTPQRTAEEIKALIVDTNPDCFFLKLPKDETAPYRKLYYRSERLKSTCKVDILIPGTMYLPNLRHSASNDNTTDSVPSTAPSATAIISPSSQSHITVISDIPLVPFSVLLLHKLQGWSDHRVATEEHYRRRQVQDAADVRRLMNMGHRIKDLQETQPWTDIELFSEEFQSLTKQRVREYCLEFPERAEGWKLLGFETA